MGEDLDELVDLLPLARHGRDQFMLLVGHAQVGEERPGQFQVAFFLPVMCRGGHFTCVLGRVAVQHRFALFAELQLQLVAQGQQMGITERLGQ
ncbi:hypothetical protein D3C84_584020 [compost metagenome]